MLSSSLLEASLLFFPAPPSLFISAMSVISLTSLSYSGFSEVMGKHLHYSKFSNTPPINSTSSSNNNKNSLGIKLPSRIGMLVLYTPALAAALASSGFIFFSTAVPWPRGFLLASALSLHFFKRVIEVLFVHRYSGHMILDSVITISLSYFTGTVGMIYAQHLTRGMAEPAVDLKYLGGGVFLAGIAGNFYHHCLLSKLREKDGDKGYKIPKGGLFGIIICPHYLFEIISFIGISFISQTLYAFSFTLGTAFYLMGRSYATKKWYLSKFENFPMEIKALIPYVF